MEAYLFYIVATIAVITGVYLIFERKPCLQRFIPYSDDGLYCGTLYIT